jgi:hypothetical protein
MEEREAIDGAISAKTAVAAKKWGGKRYVKTLVKQARAAAKPDAEVSKPTENTVAAMKRAVQKVPEAIQRKLEEKIFEGELFTPEKVEQSARSMAAAHVRKEKPEPPDLRAVIHMWTDDLKEWNKKLKTVEPYMDYVDEVPAIAGKFRNALTELVETAREILKAAKR